MTTTSAPSRPLPDPTTRGLDLRRGLLMGLVRGAGLVGATVLYGLTISPKADPVGVGLTGFLVTVAVAGLWACFDGWRRPLRTGAVAWALAAALLVLLGQLPDALSRPALEGGWTGLGDYLSMTADGAGFMFALVVVPALVGLGVGHLVRPTRPRPTP